MKLFPQIKNLSLIHPLFWIVISFIFISIPTISKGQTSNDGPIEIIVRVRDIKVTASPTDLSFFGVNSSPDDYTFNIWAADSVDIDGIGFGAGSGCLMDNFDGPGNSMDFNTTIFSHTYTSNTVPNLITIKLDAWEDESPDQLLGVACEGTRCSYDEDFCCGGFLFGLCLGAVKSDELRCDTNLFATINYRLGNPGVWYDHGFVVGNCPMNNIYQPRIETFWRYTLGDSCNSSIVIGDLPQNFIDTTLLSDNRGYTNKWLESDGKDVFYQFHIGQPTGLNISLCGSNTFNSHLYLLDQNCNQIAFNSGGCGTDASLQIELCDTGIYYIVVDGNTISDEGQFSLTITNIQMSGSCIMSFTSLRDLHFDDPCDCDQLVELDGTYYFKDTLQVTTTPGQVLTFVQAGSSGFYISPGMIMPDATPFIETPNNSGIYILEFFKESGVQAVGSVSLAGNQSVQIDSDALPICDHTICPAFIPTLSQWSIIILGLSMMIAFVVAIYQKDIKALNS